MVNNRNFILYISGFLVSGIGSMFCNFSSGLFILNLTKSALWMSIYLAYTTIVYLLLTPIMGVVCDRIEKKKILYICDFLFGVTDLSLGLGILYGISGKAIFIAIFINSTINNVLMAIYQPASQSIIPLILKKEEMTKGFSFISTVSNFISILGTIFASIIYSAFGYSIVLIINGLSFIFSAVLELFIKIEEVIEVKEESNLIDDFKSGFSYIKNEKALVELISYSVIANFFLAGLISVVVPYMINSDLNFEPIVLAIIQISFSIGGILIAIRAANKKGVSVKKAVNSGFVNITIFMFVMMLGYFLLKYNYISNIIFIIVQAAMTFGFGVVITNIQIPTNTSYVSNIEPQYYGRVMSIRTMMASISAPVASLVYGYILDFKGVGITFIFSLVGMIFCVFYVRRSKYIEQL